MAELVSLEAVQQDLGLGPNGGLVYCMEYVAANLDWLDGKLAPLLKDGCYLLFDCPGQCELFNVHDALRNIVEHLAKKHIRCVALVLRSSASSNSLHLPSRPSLAAVHLVDSHLCADASKYLAALLQSLTTMLHLGLPHVNVLSKVDLVTSHGPLAFNLEFYTESGGGDLTRLVDAVSESKVLAKHRKLTRGLCEVIQDYGLVSFTTLNVQDEASMRRLVASIDKCNGYVFSGLEREARARGEYVSPHMYTAGQTEWPSEALLDVAERYVSSVNEDEG